MWIKYLRPEQLFGILDLLSRQTQEMPSHIALDLLQPVLNAIQLTSSLYPDSEISLRRRLPQLLSLRPSSLVSTNLEDMIAISVGASLPVAADGGPLFFDRLEDANIVSVTRRADLRWSRISEALPGEIDVSNFLTQDKWSRSTVEIITCLLKKSPPPEEQFLQWLGTEHCKHRSKDHYVNVLHAFLDSVSVHNGNSQVLADDIWTTHISRLFKILVNDTQSASVRSKAAFSLTLVVTSSPGDGQRLDRLTELVQSLNPTSLTKELLALGTRIHARTKADAKDLLIALTEQGLHWAVRRLGDTFEPSGSSKILQELSKLLSAS